MLISIALIMIMLLNCMMPIFTVHAAEGEGIQLNSKLYSAVKASLKDQKIPFTCNDITHTLTLTEENKSKVEKLLKKSVAKSWTNEETREKLSKKLKIKDDIDKKIVYKWGKYEKGDNKTVDALLWSDTSLPAGTIKFQETKNKKLTFLVLDSWVDVEPKILDECKGLVTSDYQLFLEQQWIEELRAKYKYEIYRDIYDTIK